MTPTASEDGVKEQTWTFATEPSSILPTSKKALASKSRGFSIYGEASLL